MLGGRPSDVLGDHFGGVLSEVRGEDSVEGLGESVVCLGVVLLVPAGLLPARGLTYGFSGFGAAHEAARAVVESVVGRVCKGGVIARAVVARFKLLPKLGKLARAGPGAGVAFADAAGMAVTFQADSLWMSSRICCPSSVTRACCPQYSGPTVTRQWSHL